MARTNEAREVFVVSFVPFVLQISALCAAELTFGATPNWRN
jgi:hypothetical protein